MVLEELLLKNELIKDVLNRDDVVLSKTTDEFNMSLIAADFFSGKKSLFVVASNIFKAQKYYDELINIVSEEDVLFYPADELLTVEIISMTGDFKYERINTIKTLVESNKKRIIVTNLNAAIKYQMPKCIWNKSLIKIKNGDVFDLDNLIDTFIALGYENQYTVTKTGEYSKRGSIIDVFPLNSENPIRIDFFDDEVDSIREFSVETQRSIKKVSEVVVFPVTELLYNNTTTKGALSKFREFIDTNKLSDIEKNRYEEDYQKIKEHDSLDDLSRYLRFFCDEPETIFSFVENKKTYLLDIDRLENVFDHMIIDLEDYCRGVAGYSLLKLDYFANINYLKNLNNKITINSLNETPNSVAIHALDVPNFKGDFGLLAQTFASCVNSRKVICYYTNFRLASAFKEMCEKEAIAYKNISKSSDVDYGFISLVYNEYAPQFILDIEDLYVVSLEKVFAKKERKKNIKYKSIFKNSVKIKRYDELEVGDYVVHYQHGIGKYLGVVCKEVNKLKRDYLHVAYAKGGSLYIPLEQVSLIQKFQDASGVPPKLNSIGGTEWTKEKLKARKRIRDISANLIKIYANRRKQKGIEFLEDSSEQREFEASFEYELTPDQAKAVEDVKKDMESDRPMDRLVCGDVGYGKTEVALRAAFKAILSGYQVAVLAPTTILSRQHYYTFLQRMESFGVRVELLNRFVSAKKTKEVTEGLLRGNVDLVVGTHKLLSNKIKYHKLGLLIIDEEQRFGVTHKEKIKEIKANVDSLTLSATPIPRTLQMSIMGIKDLSLIETPPKNRYPIQTYVVSRQDNIIAQAIERELARGGQVFYLYNKVADIDTISTHIHELVPEARVCVAHGKMDKRELENTLINYISGDYNVLVCTTIIETGIDLPNTNTLIIHDADKLGLSQMYQIRGRVGRSNRIAYAYMMYDGRKILNSLAEQRLKTIRDFTDLGSGYKIAMRDLSIRGAGDILGAEQSGFVEAIGLDMYLKILDEEISKTKDDSTNIEVQKPEEEIEKDPSIKEVMFDRYIPKEYISNEDMKVKMHKRIDNMQTYADLEDLSKEFIDRFGVYNEELAYYMYEKLFNKLCDKLQIYKKEDNKQEVVVYMSSTMTSNISGQVIFDISSAFIGKVVILYGAGEIKFKFIKDMENPRQWIINADKFLDKVKVGIQNEV